MDIDVKICGLKSPESVQAALENGARHLGFIFFEKSPRHVTPKLAGLLREPAKGRAHVVAVTVDASDAYLDEIVDQVRPDLLQLHGSESPARVREVRLRHALPVMKAFSIRDVEDFKKVAAYEGVADKFLFDAKPPRGSDLPGGNGVSFDWTLLRDFQTRTPWMLSGGLNSDNINEAISISGAHGIDVSSGVESAPGEKDLELIANFLRLIARVKISSVEARQKLA